MIFYNYDTKKFDDLNEIPEDYQDYIPQTPAAQNLYELLTEDMGWGHAEAAKHILEILTESE